MNLENLKGQTMRTGGRSPFLGWAVALSIILTVACLKDDYSTYENQVFQFFMVRSLHGTGFRARQTNT